ncbi:MAG TPA: hypothetical protein VMZ25_06005 [Terriglobales bacterium]|nr:hypothetical protein [Terriglobales bacterium]
MIFGFNTDVKAADNVVYHVQSEARVNDLLLQTQIFVKGHCIGKRASSYAELAVQPDFSTEAMHEMLKAQHKLMLEGVKAGKMQELFCSDGEVQDVNAGGLAVKWLNSDATFGAAPLVLKLLVNDRGQPAEGALLTSRLSLEQDAHIHSQSMTEADGTADLEIQVPADAGAELTVLVRAKTGDEGAAKSITRKFRIKRA